MIQLQNSVFYIWPQKLYFNTVLLDIFLSSRSLLQNRNFGVISPQKLYFSCSLVVFLLHFGRNLVVFGIVASHVKFGWKVDNKQQHHVIVYLSHNLWKTYFTKLTKINNYFLKKVYWKCIYYIKWYFENILFLSFDFTFFTSSFHTIFPPFRLIVHTEYHDYLYVWYCIKNATHQKPNQLS